MKIKDYQKILRYDLTSFTRFAFDILYYHEEYHHNWHIDALAQALMQVSEGKIKRLIINMPPRTLKSHCVSIAFPAWLLGRDPRQKILYLHGSNALGRDLDEACFDLMSSSRYRALFPSTRITLKKNKISTSFGGHRQFMPINGRLTGLGADIVIIDDPISTADARDPKARLQLHQQFDDNISQRLCWAKMRSGCISIYRLSPCRMKSGICPMDARISVQKVMCCTQTGNLMSSC